MREQSIFKQRRQKLAQAMCCASLVVIPSALEVERNHDNMYPFRQNNDFYYLTGFNEPESIFVLLKDADKQVQSILFNRQKDVAVEQWVGTIVGQEAACDEYGFDHAYPINQFQQEISLLLTGLTVCYGFWGHRSAFDTQFMKYLEQLRKKVRVGTQVPDQLIHLSSILHQQRWVKDKSEVALMRKAAEISAQAHCNAMRTTKVGMFEYEVEAKLRHDFMSKGAKDVAYPPIVAGAQRACILHYNDNDQPLLDGDLLLIDAGCEYHNYASDITRTFPVNGKFSVEQKMIYNIVLSAQTAVIDAIKPGVEFDVLQHIARLKITKGLVSVGILQGEVEELVEQKAYLPYYMHNIGHWIGLDTHDVGVYKKKDQSWMTLQAGVVLTVEPGIYIAKDAAVDAKWQGIGVRIEDDVLVTDEGCDVLTSAVPKTIEAIEGVCASRLSK